MNANLDAFFIPRVRREYLDQDYLSTLSKKDLEWLNKFMGEYYGANLDFKQLRKNLHKSKKLKKECTDRNNRQNNDLYGVTKSVGLMMNVEDYSKDIDEKLSSTNPELTELALCEKIDKQKV